MTFRFSGFGKGKNSGLTRPKGTFNFSGFPAPPDVIAFDGLASDTTNAVNAASAMFAAVGRDRWVIQRDEFPQFAAAFEMLQAVSAHSIAVRMLENQYRALMYDSTDETGERYYCGCRDCDRMSNTVLPRSRLTTACRRCAHASPSYQCREILCAAGLQVGAEFGVPNVCRHCTMFFSRSGRRNADTKWTAALHAFRSKDDRATVIVVLASSRRESVVLSRLPYDLVEEVLGWVWPEEKSAAAVDRMTYFIVNRATGLVMDVCGNSRGAGAKIIQWPCHRGQNQMMKLSKCEDACYQILPQHCNQPLSMADGDVLRLGEFARVGPTCIKFRFVRNAEGFYAIHSESGLALCVVPGTHDVSQGTFTGELTQQWRLDVTGFTFGVLFP